MTCRYCGTPLPDGALFCGECGQPVAAAASNDAATGSSVIVAAARSARSAGAGPATGAGNAADVDLAEPDDAAPPSAGFSIADLAFSSSGETSQPDDDDRDLPDGSPLDGSKLGHGTSDESAARCPQCGERMAHGDVFCGECGFVLRTVTPPSGINLITLGEFPADPEAPASASTEHDAGHDADATTELERLGVDEFDAEDGDDDESGEDGEDGDGDDGAAGIDHLV